MGERLVTGATEVRPGPTTMSGPRAIPATIAPWAGIVGAISITLGSVVTALAYSGSEGEPYSPLSHWVSELGQLGVSSLAMAFNVSLMISGACLAVFMLGLAASRTGWLRYIYGPVGVISGIAGTFVGIAPMNFIDTHTIAAQAFFNLGWIAVGLASIDFTRRPEARFPRWLSTLGGVTVLAFISFLIAFGQLDTSTGHPPFRLVVTLEWLVLAGIMTWVLLASWRWLRAP